MKQTYRFQMDFKGRWAGISAFFMGFSFFFRVVHYFGLRDLSTVPFSEVLLFLILPLLLCLAYTIFLSVLRSNTPGFYGLMGAALCILLMIWNFSTVGTLRAVLGVIAYLGAAFLLVVVTGGFFPVKIAPTALLLICVLVRLCCIRLKAMGAVMFFREVSVIGMLISLTCLPLALRPVRTKAANRTQTE